MDFIIHQQIQQQFVWLAHRHPQFVQVPLHSNSVYSDITPNLNQQI
jgi:hypothetical protein